MLGRLMDKKSGEMHANWGSLFEMSYRKDPSRSGSIFPKTPQHFHGT